MNDVRKGAELDLKVEKLAFGGKALAHHDGLVIFMDHALPGQRVRVKLTKRKKQFAEGYVQECLSQSPHYTEPFCPHFGVCGGCSWQDLQYEEQLRWKRQHVLESLEHLAGVGEATVHPTVASPATTGYRNKMEFTFSNRCWVEQLPRDYDRASRPDSLALGLHARRSFEAVVNLDQCFLESPLAIEILKEVRGWCGDTRVPAYSTRTHEGFWRFLVIREGKRTNQLMVHLLTSSQGNQGVLVEGLADHLQSRFPGISTVVHSITDRKAQIASGDLTRHLSGLGFIEDRLGPLKFRISPHSFFQTNTLAAEQLYQAILEAGDFNGRETVWDLYCGTGSIALFIAAHVKQVVGFEVSEEAISDAYDNCALNGIDNCSFVSGDLKDVLRQVNGSVPGYRSPDVVITDPPRAGLHPRVLKALLDMAPPRIIAVSCNPATLARDLVVLLQQYEIEFLQPFDLFPHTPHIECLVKLKKK